MPLHRAAQWFLLLALSACGFQKSLPPAELQQLYAAPLTPPDKPLWVFHIGHSLVNRDMPMMLEQLAGEGHEHRSQLGWGATLQSHWEPGVPINGFEHENAHARYQDALQAVRSGNFDVLVLTEMAEIRGAIKWFDSPKYLRRWAREARTHRPNIRVYLYETWHQLDDKEGWLERLDKDLGRYWQGEILAKGLAHGDTGGPVHVIPAGQVLARLVRAIEGSQGVPGLQRREDLFALNPDGTQDQIHLNDLGNYLVALTHYAVLYHRSPVGLPHELLKADGTPAVAPSPEAARLMQKTVWEVVRSLPQTGVSASAS
ncbi:MAG TPA: hypothetical protein PKC60_02200 [Hydrogenophaga sp.]|uniref:hypothetical protein n=1 Tax=Hydrogenophaga sp. TaxID=1904254 RepID=UPI002BC24BAF|nr:hypothetical protein [Hydrogenophaga sp.]HMN92018.1 hypothetical protein [Hydrogenophaga sp.]HMP08820.1 hypothetical protein [Hydrogenophaga sp.]